MRPMVRFIASAVVAAAATCAVYDESLLTGAGGSAPDGSVGGAGGSAGSGGAGGSAECSAPADCPGDDTECQRRTCRDAICGVEYVATDTPLAQQTLGDCVEKQCDGRGGVKDAPLAADADDGLECTEDACEDGAPVRSPAAAGTPCAQGGTYCDGAGACVECTEGSQCPSGVCNSQHRCAPAACTDDTQNGAETDVDCGGADCAGCAVGQRCMAPSDCQSGNCSPNGVCRYEIVMSEVRSRGPLGGSDDFIELYNPTDAPVVLDSQWKLEARNASGTTYTVRWTGSGAAVPAHAHYLIAGTAYAQAPRADAALAAGITDAASVRLLKGTGTADALCYYSDATSQAQLVAADFTCEGPPVPNPVAGMEVTGSLERLPGGALGNGTDTDVNMSDFVAITLAAPQNLESPITP